MGAAAHHPQRRRDIAQHSQARGKGFHQRQKICPARRSSEAPGRSGQIQYVDDLLGGRRGLPGIAAFARNCLLHHPAPPAA